MEPRDVRREQTEPSAPSTLVSGRAQGSGSRSRDVLEAMAHLPFESWWGPCGCCLDTPRDRRFREEWCLAVVREVDWHRRLLDGEFETSFATYLKGRDLSERAAEVHDSNASWFLWDLGQRNVPLASVHEFDLRYFLFRTHPELCARDTDFRAVLCQMALLESLWAYFGFLAEVGGIDCPWAEGVLAEGVFFRTRRDTYPDHEYYDLRLRGWERELAEALHARALLPATALGPDGDQWGATMEPAEGILWVELQRRWLIWRDDAIEAGITEPDAVRRAAARRQLEWELCPHPAYRWKTPLEVVRYERTS